MGEAKEVTDTEKANGENKFQKAREKWRKTIRYVKKALNEGNDAMSHTHVGVQNRIEEMTGLRKALISIVIVLVAEATVQQMLLFLNRYVTWLANVVESYAAQIETLSPADQIALLILGTLITATFLLSLQLRTIGYSLNRTNLSLEELKLAYQGVPLTDGERTAPDGGETVGGETEQDGPQNKDAKVGRSTSRVGAIGGAMAGGTYGAIFGVAGILAGIAIGAMFGEEMEKRIVSREQADRQRLERVRGGAE